MEDYVYCFECNPPKKFKQITTTHLKTHGITMEEYLKRHPGANLVCQSVREKLVAVNIMRWKDTDYKENIARQNRDFTVNHQKPRFTDTVIEVMMQDILRHHGYKFETHFRVCGICRPDIVFPEKKIAIFCDGDYWHNLPNYVKRDQNQDRVLKMNGWVSMRFWEHEIHENLQDCFRKIESVYNDTEYVPYYRQGTLEDW